MEPPLLIIVSLADALMLPGLSPQETLWMHELECVDGLDIDIAYAS